MRPALWIVRHTHRHTQTWIDISAFAYLLWLSKRPLEWATIRPGQSGSVIPNPLAAFALIKEDGSSVLRI
jgi:hypothetical protein